MHTAELMSDALAVDLARECLYRFLGVALSDPYTDGWRAVVNAENQCLATEAADLLRAETAAEPAALGFGELPPEQLDLHPLLAQLERPVAELREEYDQVFGLVPARECPPFETEYHPTSETFFRTQQLADVAGFYRAFGIEPAAATPERPDHLALELEFMAFVLMKKRLALTGPDRDVDGDQRASVCDEAQRTFFRDHLAWWVPAFATGLRRKAGSGYYAAVGQVLAALIPVERRRFDVPAPRVPLQPALIERPEEQAGCAGCAAPV
jgi:TorA maturation chaperone TorD